MSNVADPGSPDPQPQPSSPYTGSSAAGSDPYATPPPPPSYSAPPPTPGYGYSGTPAPAGGPPVEALAGFWIRFGAAFIDNIILSVVVGILATILGLGSAFGTDPGDGVSIFFNPSRALQYLIAGAYFTYLHASATGQTLGNRMVGIRVVDAATGATIPYSRSLIRYLMSLVSAAALSIGYLWMLFDSRKQTWHDKVANTLVVRSSFYPPTGEFGRPAAS